MTAADEKEQRRIASPTTDQPFQLPAHAQKPSVEEVDSGHQSRASTSELINRECHQSPSGKVCSIEISSAPPLEEPDSEEVSPTPKIAPCKLNAYLAANPGADVT